MTPARSLFEPSAMDAEYDDDYGSDDLECTHCGGEGLCWDGSDPLGNCPDDPHRCHACGGSGNRKDQTIF
jgi:hypothetical protein